MQPVTRFLLAAGLFLVFCGGCAYQATVTLPPVAYPESIFVRPTDHNLSGTRVLVFRFQEPDYAPEVGLTAARCIANALQSAAAANDIVMEYDSLGLDLQQMNRIALRRGYDRFITGRVNAYFAGSDFESTVVAEEIWVYRAGRPRAQLLWHAAAREGVAPRPLSDYIFVHTTGAPACSALVLLKRNAEKFSNLLRDLPTPENG